MSSILFRIQEFIRRFARKLHLLLNRQDVFLVDETGFIKLFDENIKENPNLYCCYCEKKLDRKNVKGYFFDDDGNIHFFCDDPSCNKKHIKDG